MILLRFLLFPILLLPLIEIAVLILVGSSIGVLATIGLIILAGLLGIAMLRIQGFAVLAKMRSEMELGQAPDKSMADAAMIAMAGVLLIIPGFISDIVGILLFLPPVRALIRGFIGRRVTIVRSAKKVRPDVVDLDPADFRRTDVGADSRSTSPSSSPSPWRLPDDKR